MSTAVARLSTDNKDSRAREGMRSGAVTNELKKLLQHSSHYLSGILISLAVGFISFPIFTRAFSVSEYGTIDLIAKVLLLLTALSKMGLQQSALRFYDGSAFSSDQASARRYYSTMLGGVALTAAFATALFLGGVSRAEVVDQFIAQGFTGPGLLTDLRQGTYVASVGVLARAGKDKTL